MTSKKEARLNMFHAVIGYCESNAPITAKVPAFVTVLKAFKTKVSSINSTALAEAQIVRGMAPDKSQLRKNLSQQAADIAAAVFAYAINAGNNELKQQVNLSLDDLYEIKDDLLAPVCLKIHDAANANLSSLSAYGVTTAILTSLNTAIADYSSKLCVPENGSRRKTTYFLNLDTLFNEANSILKYQMDKISVEFKSSNFDFYNCYKYNRIILDDATATTQLCGKVVNTETNNPISDVIVEVVDAPYICRTDANGNYTLKIPVAGEYKIEFTHGAHLGTIIGNIKITLGNTTTLNVDLADL